MTARQIKTRLEKAGISLEGVEIKKDEIEICIGYYEENGFGNCDDEAIEARHIAIAKILPCFSGGYYTQYGSLICPKDYEVSEYDYCDTSHPAHY